MTRQLPPLAREWIKALVVLAFALLLVTHPHSLDFVLHPLVDATMSVLMAVGRLVSFVIAEVFSSLLDLPRG